uniref:AP2/ERF domain-containing protein n=1 Tax=Euplotes harpa TaxID=151035 RepID=A0A7S3NFF3_9SPIT|mmetsp:Transcript_40458/g.46415  ORF Transcript_40458/g.46415 Transcript_40458/m.46415 type:complete len:106 (+) Transcript_40458:277-594(+)
MNKIDSELEVLVHGRTKSAVGPTASRRRSQYIGVFKNGANWQALITINKRKVYIGTYATELQAARAFDFHSLLLHGILATTNFDYCKEEIVGLAERYLLAGSKFI